MAASKITLPFVTLDVFTSTPFEGNPLGLVLLKPEHHALAQGVKQRVAREFNLSETVFLHVPVDEEAAAEAATTSLRLDIFTADEELPFAGHPTIGTAWYVLSQGGALRDVRTLDVKAGPIAISGDGAEVRAAIPHDVHLHSRTLGSLLGQDDDAAPYMARLSPDATVRAAELAAPVVSVVKGMAFLLAELPDLAALARAWPGPSSGLDPASLPSPGLQDAGPWAGGFVSRYYYVLLGHEAASDEEGASAVVRVRTRHVELRSEDPATGSAASALASYLAMSGRVGGEGAERIRFEVEQGVEMGRRSLIRVEVVREKFASEAGGWKVKELLLGGVAVAMMKGTITV